MKKAASFALGCKVNQYETQALETLFAQRGHEISPSEQDCEPSSSTPAR